MRKFYLLFVILLITFTTWSQTRSWNGGNGNWNDRTKWTPAGIPGEDDIIEFNSSSATINNVPNLTCKGIIISGADIILNAAGGDAKKLSISNPVTDRAVHITAGSSLTIGNNLDFGLDIQSYAFIEGALIISPGRKYYTDANGSKSTVSGLVRNSGGMIYSSASTLEFENGGEYEHAMDKGVLPSATWQLHSTCKITGVITQSPGGIDQVFGNFTWDNLNQAPGALPGAGLPAMILGTLSINHTGNSTSASIFVTLPEKMKIGSFILNEGACIVNGKTATIDIEGDFIMTGGLVKAVAAGNNSSITFNFNGAARRSLSKQGGSIEKSSGALHKAEIKFIVAENSIVDFGESVLDGDAGFILSKGSRMITSHLDGIASAGKSGAVQVIGVRSFSSEAEYVFTGMSHQKTGLGLPSVVKKLVIDNNGGSSHGGVFLSKPVAVSNELVLENGFLQTTQTNMLTILDGATATTYNSAFVEGPMRKAGKAAFVFPTGWSGAGGGLIPIGISSINSYSVIQAEYKRAPATNKGNTIKAPLHHISYCEYWEMFPVTGNPTAIITMYRNAHSACNPTATVMDLSTVRVARSDGSAWTDIGNEDGSMNGGTGYVVSDSAGTAITYKDRYFTLGNISSARDPLPVMYDSVYAYEKNGGVYIEWSNLTERDIATYFVERSVNGKDYTVISQHLPKSNRDDRASYLSFDPGPAPGTNFYRVKTIEKNTKIIFSKIMRIETDVPGQKFTLYPNPVSGNQVTLSLAGLQEGVYQMKLINSAGQVIHQANILSQGNYATLSFGLPQHIKTGIYNVIVKGNNYQQSKTFIVQ